MNKRIMILLILVSFFYINVNATTGTIKQNSVIECNGKYYGSHGTPKHWHEVKKENDKWVSVSSEVTEPSCYADIANEKEEVVFNKCIDGDTFRVTNDGEIKTIRFLAIDTPESVHPTKEVEDFGKEASEYTCNLLTNAKKIYLEYDKNSDKEDKYGRLLAFVYADDVMLQKELIKVGYAKVAYLYGDYSYVKELQELEATAKESKLGIWQESTTEVINDPVSTEEKERSTLELILDFLSKIIDNIFNLIKNML